MQFFADTFREWRGWFAVHAEHLLPGSMRPSCQESRFGRSGPTLGRENTGYIHAFGLKIFAQSVAGGIVAHGCYRNDSRAQRVKIVCGIGTASGEQMRMTVAQD